MVLPAVQDITCGALAADPEYLAEFKRSKESAPAAAVSRAVCVLDQPLQVRPHMYSAPAVWMAII